MWAWARLPLRNTWPTRRFAVTVALLLSLPAWPPQSPRGSRSFDDKGLSIKVSSKRPPALGDPTATGDPARHVGTGTRTPSSSSDGEPCGARGGCSLCSRLRMRAGTGRELPHSRWHDDDVAPGVALGTRPASSPSATWRCSHSPSARSYLPVQSHRPAPSTRHLRREVTHSLGSWAVVLTG